MKPTSILVLIAMSVSIGLTACGGGSSSTDAVSASSPGTTSGPSASNTPAQSTTNLPVNTVPVVVTAPPRTGGFNRPFVSVTICTPGASTCQVIDNVLLDTGSVGFRVLASALNPALVLPQITDSAGRQVGACALFGTGQTTAKAATAGWGSVRKADLKMADMTAPSLSIEVINDASFLAAPERCSNAADSVIKDFGFNGVLGVRGFDADCGTACENGNLTTPRYYGCDTTECSPITLAVSSQIRNPVTLFAPGYDNGTVVKFPPVPDVSNSPLYGTLTFGIGNRENNQLGNAQVFGVDSSGLLMTIYNGMRMRASFDTGNVYIVFYDPALQRCTAPLPTSLYCPTSSTSINAVNQGTSGIQSLETMLIMRPTSPLPRVGSFGAYTDNTSVFTWGLPFYFGRTTFTAIQGKNTPAGIGPYIAY